MTVEVNVSYPVRREEEAVVWLCSQYLLVDGLYWYRYWRLSGSVIDSRGNVHVHVQLITTTTQL